MIDKCSIQDTSGTERGKGKVQTPPNKLQKWLTDNTYFFCLASWRLRARLMNDSFASRERACKRGNFFFMTGIDIYKKNYLSSCAGVFNRHKLGRHQDKTSKKLLDQTMHTETQIYSISVHQELGMDIKGRALRLQTRHLKHFYEHTDDMIAKIWGVIGSMTLRFECLERQKTEKKLEPICP